MAINLHPLFVKQRQLDEYIIKTKGLEGQDLLLNKILALQVELGELANEWRGFKHWSEKQTPAATKTIVCPTCKGIGKHNNPITWDCRNCLGTGIQIKENPLLEEYVDCLHFIVSIGLEVVSDEWILEIEEENVSGFENEEIVGQFLYVMENVKSEMDVHDWFYLVAQFHRLGIYLGFTWEQIEQAYLAKWEENIRRQKEGY